MKEERHARNTVVALLTGVLIVTAVVAVTGQCSGRKWAGRRRGGSLDIGSF
jgi:hypothetical protein